jgi:uncharacterized protein YyaL (SSP411 family)
MNQLYKASSPYLQQHAHNPVHWHEWNEKTLNKAKTENKPLFISIGYAACHWCHVMARETFMNDEVAAELNSKFICIKIDREERPDIDQVYMDALHALKGSGGWPLNAFALPNGKPFYAGTYYKTLQFISVIQQLYDHYQNNYMQLVEQALQLTNNIQKSQFLPINDYVKNQFNKDFFLSLINSWKGRIDVLRGGFGNAPKFPLPVGWDFLLNYFQNTKDQEILKAVNNTLTAMAKGGIYDQIGGGFARYSVDNYWRVPHFEKMLYDNGQLISLYAKAYLLDKNPLYKKVIEQTLTFVNELLTDENGGFYASLNADSEGEEGTFYIFTKKEIEENFPPEIANFIVAYYHITEEGNWEHGKNTLFTTYTNKTFADKTGNTIESIDNLLLKSNSALYKYRKQRIHPTTDTKILTGWNALMLQGFIDAYIAIVNPIYIEIALKNAHFIVSQLIDDNYQLYRNYKDENASISGFLEDYALLAEAFIKLYQVTLDVKWITISKNLVDYSITHFYDEKVGFFNFTSNLDTALFTKKQEVFDNVIPSSNAVITTVLYQLGLLFEEQNYTQLSDQLLLRMIPQLSNSGPYTAKWASLLGFKVHGSQTVVVVGNNAKEYTLELMRNTSTLILIFGGVAEEIPYLKNKLINNKTSIYICKNNTCSAPIYAIEEALKILNNT